MNNFNGLKRQDILVLLYIITKKGDSWKLSDIASELEISLSETSMSLERCRICHLIDSSKKKVSKQNLREFLIHGLKYVYPAEIGSQARGIITGHSADLFVSKIATTSDNYVWPYYKGTRRGNSLKPLYPTVPKIANKNNQLYELLVIIDTLRTGKIREIELAIELLDKYFSD